MNPILNPSFVQHFQQLETTDNLMPLFPEDDDDLQLSSSSGTKLPRIVKGDQFFQSCRDGEMILPNEKNDFLPDIDALLLFPDEKRESLPSDPYEEFFFLVDKLFEYETGLCEFLSETVGIDFENYSTESAKLKELILPHEIEMFVRALEWMCLLNSGHVPTCKDKKSLQEFVGVDSFVDLLDPEQWSTKTRLLPPIVMRDFIFAAEDAVEREGKVKEIAAKISDTLYSLADVQFLISNILCYNDPNDSSFTNCMKDYFYELKFDKLLRWSLFGAICAHLDTDGLAVPSLEMRKTMAPEMFAILAAMDQPRKKVPLSRGMSLPTIALTAYQPPVNTLKLLFPDFPNWMPNGGNSCYISSSLWALYFLAHTKIADKIASFSVRAPNVSEEVHEARITFVNLYQAMSSKQLTTIDATLINEFRSAMQKAYPWAFFSPTERTQEDAYEFLRLITETLLDMDFCAADASKFYKQHTFTRSDDAPLVEPEIYNYGEALETVLREEEIPLIDISLDDQEKGPQELRALVTHKRQTQTRARHAYKPKLPDEEKQFKEVMAHHFEQIAVESIEKAPEYFICRLGRFSLDLEANVQKKRFDYIFPNATLHVTSLDDDGQTVSYDLSTVIVHSGVSLEAGHYYVYVRKQTDDEWNFYKFDDISGISECLEEQNASDTATNGYTLLYKKRVSGEAAPPPLFFEEDEEEIVDETKIEKSEIKIQEQGRDEMAIDLDPDIAFSVQEKKSSGTLDSAEVKQWIEDNLNGTFSLDENGLRSLEEFLFCHFQFEVDEELIKRTSTRTREWLVAASRFLKRSIYLIEPSNDLEIVVIDSSYVVIGDHYRHGEEFDAPIIFIYKQEDGTHFLLTKNEL